MDSLPNAADFRSNISKENVIANDEKHDKHVENLKLATESLANGVIDKISVSIKKKYANTNQVWFDIYNPFNTRTKLHDIPAHIVWYGHIKRGTKTSWTVREPLKEVNETAFQKVQKYFLNKGFRVYEISDPNKGFSIVIRVVADDNYTDTYLENPDCLWHKHNIVGC